MKLAFTYQVFLVLSAAALLASCVTNSSSEADESELETETSSASGGDVGSFLPDASSGSGGANSGSESPVPKRDYSEFEFAEWEIKPRDAMRQAIAEDKLLLVLMTATSWSETAEQLNNEVILSKTFNDFVRDRLVLTFLDYPKSITQAHESMRKFKTRYNVRGFPTLLLLDHKGNELWRRTGYSGGKAKDYFDDFKRDVEQVGV